VETGKDKRYFDREFKYENIRLMNEGKRSVSDIAKDLNVTFSRHACSIFREETKPRV